MMLGRPVCRKRVMLQLQIRSHEAAFVSIQRSLMYLYLSRYLSALLACACLLEVTAAPKERDGTLPLNLAWAQSLGSTNSDSVECIAVSRQGDVFVSGSFTRESQIGGTKLRAIDPTDLDAFLAKLNARGEVVWAQAIQGFAFTFTRALALDEDGNVLLTGGFSDFLLIDESRLEGSFLDSFVAKFTSDGALLWMHATEPRYRYAFNAAFDSNGNIYIGGTSNLQGIVARYAATGELLGVHQVSAASSVVLGTAVDDHNRWFVSVSDAAEGRYVASLTPEAAPIWTRGIPAAGPIAAAKNGTISVTGQFSGRGQVEGGPLFEAPESGYAGYVASFNHQGQFLEASVIASGQWVKANGIAAERPGDWVAVGEEDFRGYLATPLGRLTLPPGPTGGAVRPQAIALDSKNNIYVGGEFFFSAHLLDTNLFMRAQLKNGFIARFNRR
jgi:hypothetical protein